MEVRPAVRDDLVSIARVAHASGWASWSGLLRPETIAAMLERSYSPRVLKRRLLEGGLLVAVGSRDEVLAFAEITMEGEEIAVHIHATAPAVPDDDPIGDLLAAVRRRLPDRPICVDVLLGDLEEERCCEEAGYVPGEVIQHTVCGEAVVERRWWPVLPI
jgi:hypothetical protein